MADILDLVKITAILTPAPNKAERLEEVLLSHSAYVQDNEPNTLQWEILKSCTGDEVKFIAWEVYKNKMAMRTKIDSQQFVDLMETLNQEALLANDILVYVAKSKGGVTGRDPSGC